MIMKYKDLGNMLSKDEMKRVKGGYATEIHCTHNCPAGQSAVGHSGDDSVVSCSDIVENGVVTGLRITISGGVVLNHLCSGAA